jgi:hypothetical protein
MPSDVGDFLAAVCLRMRGRSKEGTPYSGVTAGGRATKFQSGAEVMPCLVEVPPVLGRWKNAIDLVAQAIDSDNGDTRVAQWAA